MALGSTSASAENGGVLQVAALSPQNRFVADSVSSPEEGFDLHISTVTTQKGVRRTLHAASRSLGAVWLSEHWLAALADDKLLLYDAEEDVVVTPPFSVRYPTQLVFQPAG